MPILFITYHRGRDQMLLKKQELVPEFTEEELPQPQWG